MTKLLSALYEHAQRAPAKPALLLGKHDAWFQFSNDDLLAETERWARRFASLDIVPGRIVFIVLDHRADLYGSFLGAMRAGLVPSFLPYPTPKQDARLYWSSHAELFERVRPACVLGYDAVLPQIALLAAGTDCLLLDCDEAAPFESTSELPPLATVERGARMALLQHSSGTTGLKKGVALTFDAVAAQVDSYAKAIGARPDDKTVSWLPLYHDMGLIAAFLLPITLGTTIVSIDAFDWLLKPAMLFELIERHRATLAWLPNFAFNHLLRTDDGEAHDLSSMRAFVSSSEPCKPATFDAFLAHFAAQGLAANALQTSYAMAEAVFAVTQSDLERIPQALDVDAEALSHHTILELQPGDPKALRLLSCGEPIDGIEVRITPEAASESGDASTSSAMLVGEIEIRGGFVFNEYYRNPEATAESFDGEWYRTGDMGFMRNGELFVCGRKKEMLIVHGRNFYAHDIEAIANGISGVKPGRVAVFSVFDAMTASEEAIVLAESELTDPPQVAELRRLIRATIFDELGLQAKAVEIRRVGELVKTTSGKMSRAENARRYVEAGHGSS